jgi:hypothetical protein
MSFFIAKHCPTTPSTQSYICRETRGRVRVGVMIIRCRRYLMHCIYKDSRQVSAKSCDMLPISRSEAYCTWRKLLARWRHWLSQSTTCSTSDVLT